MKNKRFWALSACVAFAAMFKTPAFSTADGPDAWRVVNVTSDDTLNVRFGPTTAYDVKTELPNNQNGLQQTTCVPLVNMAEWFTMTENQQNKLMKMPRWCLISLNGEDLGWVNARFLGMAA